MATPSCGCAVTYADGIGDTFYNCNPDPTVSLQEAVDACVAYETANGITQAEGALWSTRMGDSRRPRLEFQFSFA